MWIELRDLCHLQSYLKHISMTDHASNTKWLYQVKKNIETITHTHVFTYEKSHEFCVTSFLEILLILGEFWMDVKWNSANKLNARQMFYSNTQGNQTPKIQPKQSSNCKCTQCMLVNMTMITCGLYSIVLSLHTMREPFEEKERWHREIRFFPIRQSMHAKSRQLTATSRGQDRLKKVLSHAARSSWVQL